MPEIEEKKKITAVEAIVRMIKAINEDKDADFYSVAHEFAESLAFSGGNRWKVLNAIKMKPMRLRKLDDMPHHLKGLLIQRKQRETSVFLTKGVSAIVDTLLMEWANREVYDLHKIPVRNKILLHGPTGNGKTTIARDIAVRSQLPFIEINSDSVIDSKLGASSANIHNVLNSIDQPCVLFWDEIDSIGIKRGTSEGSAASHENDRMTNSFLINMERLGDKVILIGATNRMNVLDSAFLRRFDIKIEIPAPSTMDKVLFVDQLLTYHQIPSEEYKDDLTALPSFSEIKNRIMEIGRQYLLSLQKPTHNGS